MADQILPKGFRLFSPRPNQPDFVKGSIVISLNKFFSFIKAHPEFQTEYQGEKQIKLQILESKAGSLYSAIDTYKPGDKPKVELKTANTSNRGKSIVEDDDSDGLPF